MGHTVSCCARLTCMLKTGLSLIRSLMGQSRLLHNAVHMTSLAARSESIEVSRRPDLTWHTAHSGSPHNALHSSSIYHYGDFNQDFRFTLCGVRSP